MERSLFLLLALIGGMVGGALEWAGVRVGGYVVLGIAGTCLLVWVVALGVYLGIRDALAEDAVAGRRATTEEILRRSRQLG